MDLRRVVRSRVASVFFFGASLASVWGVAAGWFHVASPEGLAAVGVLACLLAFEAVLLIWQEYRFSRKARYAEALPNLLELVRLMSGQAIGTPETCLVTMKSAVREISEALTLATGTRVSVCLKKVVWVASKARGRAEDVCRDPKSEDRSARSQYRLG